MTINKDISALFDEKRKNPYKKHFLLANPFPGYGEVPSDVCTDQNILKKEFASILQNSSTVAKRLRINGGSGAGKTNILRYFERLTDEARERQRIQNFRPVYIYAPGENYFNIHEQIVDKLTGLFLNNLIKTLQSEYSLVKTLSSKVKSANELLGVISAIIQPDMMTLFSDEERQKDIFIRWMKGQKLTAADKKLLTHAGKSPVDITNSSLAIRFLYGFIELLKELDMCDGVVLLFDEFEEIFKTLTRSYQARYAQDLRHLLDMLNESVFFVIATVPEPKDLAQYPTIERRLGKTVELQPIESLELAMSYVSEYLNSGRDKYEAYLKEEKKEKESEHVRPKALEPLTEDDVKKEYHSLKEEFEETEFAVLPGFFLPRMHERMRQIVESDD